MIFLKKLVNLAFYALVFFLFALIALYIFSNKTLILTPKTLSNGLIAFFGAFFAFAFVKLSDWLSSIRKSSANHFNALVKIERFLNRMVSRLDRNILLCQDDIRALRSMKILVWNLPPVPCSYELADDLKNIDFINDYFTFTLDIETLNSDLNTMISMYDEIKSLFIDKNVSPGTYKDNIAFTIMRVSEIMKFMESYKSNATKLLALARILLKERKQRILLIGALPKKHYGKDIEKCLKDELTILEKEIETTKRKSQEEIDRIKKSEPKIE
jgi:hypothetical protein